MDDLLRILLVLVVVWLGLELATELLAMVLGPLFGAVEPIVGLAILALVVLWLTDHI